MSFFHPCFQFGRDPHWLPLPPPMRITRDMIEAMGGGRSQHFRRFRQHCHSAYLVLRRWESTLLKKYRCFEALEAFVSWNLLHSLNESKKKAAKLTWMLNLRVVPKEQNPDTVQEIENHSWFFNLAQSPRGQGISWWVFHALSPRNFPGTLTLSWVFYLWCRPISPPPPIHPARMQETSPIMPVSNVFNAGGARMTDRPSD